MGMFMNEYDIETAAERWDTHPVLGPATRTLLSLMHGVNACSDGWAYWQAPQRSVAKLTQMILDAEEVRWRASDLEAGVIATPARYKAACTPLKSLRTRHPALRFEIEEIAS